MTLVLTTHYMDEAEQLCDRLVVMDKAKIVAEGSPRKLIEQYSSREVPELRFPPGVQDSLDGQLDGLGATPTGSSTCPTGCSSTPTTARRSPSPPTSAGLRPESVLVRRSTLEDVFLRLTGRTLVD